MWPGTGGKRRRPSFRTAVRYGNCPTVWEFISEMEENEERISWVSFERTRGFCNR